MPAQSFIMPAAEIPPTGRGTPEKSDFWLALIALRARVASATPNAGAALDRVADWLVPLAVGGSDEIIAHTVEGFPVR